MLPEKLPYGDELWDLYAEKALAALKTTFLAIRKGTDLTPLMGGEPDVTMFRFKLAAEHLNVLAEQEFAISAYRTAYDSYMEDAVNNNREQLSLLDRVASAKV